MTKILLGRNWYEVTWFEPREGEFSDVELWADIPIVVDVLANSQEQAEAIVVETYPILREADHLFFNLQGTERQFQQLKEPLGEEDVTLLPY